MTQIVSSYRYANRSSFCCRYALTSAWNNTPSSSLYFSCRSFSSSTPFHASPSSTTPPSSSLSGSQNNDEPSILPPPKQSFLTRLSNRISTPSRLASADRYSQVQALQSQVMTKREWSARHDKSKFSFSDSSRRGGGANRNVVSGTQELARLSGGRLGRGGNERGGLKLSGKHGGGGEWGKETGKGSRERYIGRGEWESERRWIEEESEQGEGGGRNITQAFTQIPYIPPLQNLTKPKFSSALSSTFSSSSTSKSPSDWRSYLEYVRVRLETNLTSFWSSYRMRRHTLDMLRYHGQANPGFLSGLLGMGKGAGEWKRDLIETAREGEKRWNRAIASGDPSGLSLPISSPLFHPYIQPQIISHHRALLSYLSGRKPPDSPHTFKDPFNDSPDDQEETQIHPPSSPQARELPEGWWKAQKENGGKGYPLVNKRWWEPPSSLVSSPVLKKILLSGSGRGSGGLGWNEDGKEDLKIEWRFEGEVKEPEVVALRMSEGWTKGERTAQGVVRCRTRQSLRITDNLGRRIRGKHEEPIEVLEYLLLRSLLYGPQQYWVVIDAEVTESQGVPDVFGSMKEMDVYLKMFEKMRGMKSWQEGELKRRREVL